jgi:hypothetical protein
MLMKFRHPTMWPTNMSPGVSRSTFLGKHIGTWVFLPTNNNGPERRPPRRRRISHYCTKQSNVVSTPSLKETLAIVRLTQNARLERCQVNFIRLSQYSQIPPPSNHRASVWGTVWGKFRPTKGCLMCRIYFLFVQSSVVLQCSTVFVHLNITPPWLLLRAENPTNEFQPLHF